MLSPLILEATPGGRPRKTDMRQAMNAIFYLLRTGSPWRYLPRDGFPPRSTVYNIFRKFQADGTWDAIWAVLHVLLREHEGREASPTAAVMDSQTIKSAEKGGGCKARKSAFDQVDAVGYDAGKKVKGRKIHALVDTLGLPIRLVVHSAGVQSLPSGLTRGTATAPLCCWTRSASASLARMRVRRGGYDAQQTYEAAAANHPLRLQVVRRNPHAQGFELIKRRWVVERTFSWFDRNRRLAKDYENLAATVLSFVTLAPIQAFESGTRACGGVVVKSLDRRLLYCSVQPLYLAVGGGTLGIDQLVLDAVVAEHVLACTLQEQHVESYWEAASQQQRVSLENA